MHLDPETLYESHAERLYAHCWALVGEEAPAAVREAFASAARHAPPPGDTALWLHGIARAACERRGAFDPAFSPPIGGTADDPLRRAAAALRAEHREILLLSGGHWLEPGDIARLLGIAPDTTRELIAVARSRFERLVLDLLMRGTAPARPALHAPVTGSGPAAGPRRRSGSGAQAVPARRTDPAGTDPADSEEILRAFEKGTLDVLFARRSPIPPASLAGEAVAAFSAGGARHAPGVPAPLVVIGAAAERSATGSTAGRAPGSSAHGGSKGVTEALVLAACAAATVALATLWPAAGSERSLGDVLNPFSPAATRHRQGPPADGGNVSTATATAPGADRGGPGSPADPPGPSRDTMGAPARPPSAPRPGGGRPVPTEPEQQTGTPLPAEPAPPPQDDTPAPPGSPAPADPGPDSGSPDPSTPGPSDTPLPSPSPGAGPGSSVWPRG